MPPTIDWLRFEKDTIVGSFLIGITIGFAIATFIFFRALDNWKEEAVKNGVAYYNIVDTKGNTEFKWITQ
jgi:hypothetical protein